MKYMAPLFCLLLLGACSGIKKAVRINRQVNTSQQQWLQNERISKQVLLIKNDSNQTETEVLLIPKGSFTYSPQYGFVGEAHALKIVEKITSVSKEHKETNLKQKTKHLQSQTYTEKKMEKSVAVKRISFVGLGIVVLLIVLVYWYWWRSVRF